MKSSPTFSLLTEMALALSSRRASPFELKKFVLAASASTIDSPVPKSANEIEACGTPSNTAKKSFSESARRSSAVDLPKRILLAAIAVCKAAAPCTRVVMSSATAFCKALK